MNERRVMKLAAIPLLLMATSAWAADAPKWKVEYKEVEGAACLQPTRNAVDVQLEDFRAAERRWLDKNHPGWDEKRFETKHRSAPVEPLSDDKPVPMVAERDTYEIDLPDHSTQTICFAVKFRLPKATETP